MPRYFTLRQAEEMLPELERTLRDAIFHKAEYGRAGQELESNAQRIRMAGGSQVNREAYLAVRARRDTSAAALKEALDRIDQNGALVKDLDIGLIDFLTRYRGRAVCLCWKLGEEGIGFWHGTDEGFRGRRPVDEEFRRSHRGDSPN